jgi:hypothetical protein
VLYLFLWRHASSVPHMASPIVCFWCAGNYSWITLCDYCQRKACLWVWGGGVICIPDSGCPVAWQAVWKYRYHTNLCRHPRRQTQCPNSPFCIPLTWQWIM